MNRKIATALASAALLASVSVSAALAGAQTQQAPQNPPAELPTQAVPKIERTGRKQTKVVQASCPVHPEVKARTGKCPKCRAAERQQKEVQQRGQKVRQRPQQGGEDANE